MNQGPFLIINAQQLAANISAIVSKCNALSIDYRAHVKTIHDPHLSDFLNQHNVHKIAVSNCDMMQQFAAHGWQDISLASTCGYSLDAIQQVLDQGVLVTVYVDHPHHVSALSSLRGDLQLCIDIDCGQHRTGILWSSNERIMDLIALIEASPHQFSGISAHFGQLYHCESKADIIESAGFCMMRLLQLIEHLDHRLSTPVHVTIGDTPSFLSMAMFDRVNEICVGNAIFNDCTAYAKGLCDLQGIALGVQARVISVSVHDARFVLHCGAVHVSKERHIDPNIGYGKIALSTNGWWDQALPNTCIESLYQEHAVVVSTPDIVSAVSVGDLVWVIPVHSCLAMDAMYHKDRVQVLQL